MNTQAYHYLAAFFALALPFSLFVTRWVVRSQRAAIYNDLARTLFANDSLPQLEQVRAKYDTRSASTQSGASDANRYPSTIILAALIFVAFSFIGFEILLVPIECLLQIPVCVLGRCLLPGRFDIAVVNSFFWTNGSTSNVVDIQLKVQNTVAVASAGFLGAYVASLTGLVRQANTYELNVVSFVRASVQLFLGVVVSVISYRAIAGGVTQTLGLTKDPAEWWIGAGFLIGMAPEAGLGWLSRQLRLRLQKSIDPAAYAAVSIIPCDVVDGIDPLTRDRLEQNNIYDIQNLATANPIELYVETPFGLHEIFDWILQAQLCLVVGPAAFNALRRHEIRTIFDLERAVLAEGAKDAYVQAVGEVLFAKADEAFKLRLREGGASGPLNAEIVRHAVAVSLDDLHVHRLRGLWTHLAEQQSKPSERDHWLYRHRPLPGDPNYAAIIDAPLSELWLSIVAAYGRAYAEAKGVLGTTPTDTERYRKAEADAKEAGDGIILAARRALEADPDAATVLRGLADLQASEYGDDLVQFADAYPKFAAWARPNTSGDPRD